MGWEPIRGFRGLRWREVLRLSMIFHIRGGGNIYDDDDHSLEGRNAELERN